MTRPSNRELKVLSHLGPGDPLGPADFKDVGETTFTGMLKKGWIAPAEGREGAYVVTPKGQKVHVEEFHYGRFKR